MIGSKEWRKECLEKGFNEEFLDSFLLNRNKKEKINKERPVQAWKKVKEIAVLLKEKYQVEKVYLYGSLVWGKFHERSDLDIFVVGFKGNYWKAWVDVEDIASPFNFDLVCSEEAVSSLRKKVLEQGVKI